MRFLLLPRHARLPHGARLLCELVVVLLVLAATRPALADVIVLTNGREIQGHVISEEAGRVIVEVPYGTLTLPVERVKEIRREQKSRFLKRAGQNLLERNDSETGLSLLRRAWKEDPENSTNRAALLDGLQRVGRRELERRRLDRVREILQEAEAVDPKHDRITELRGRLEAIVASKEDREREAEIAFQTEDFGGAYQGFKDLMATFPEDRSRWNRQFAQCALILGHVSMEDRDFERARDLYHECLAHDPDLIRYLQTPLVFAEVELAVPLLERGDYAEARRGLQKAFDLLPTEPALAFYLAVALEGLGNYDRAASLYEKLAGPERDPIDGAGHHEQLRLRAQELLGRNAARESETTSGRVVSAGKARVHKTRHFEIHHRDLALANEVGESLEHHFLRLRKRWFPAGRGPHWKKPIEVQLHPDHDTFVAAASPPPWSQGVARTERRFGLVVSQTLHLNGSAPQLLPSVIPHEVTHLLLPHRMGAGIQIPLWLEEGLATIEEPEFKRRFYRRLVADARENDDLFPLEQLLESQGYPDEHRAPLFYAQSNSLVEFLLDRNGKRDGLDYLRDLAVYGSEATLAQDERFRSVGGLEKAWLRWLARNGSSR